MKVGQRDPSIHTVAFILSQAKFTVVTVGISHLFYPTHLVMTHRIMSKSILIKDIKVL